MQSSCSNEPAFSKAFHIPSEWLTLDDIMYLVNHSYCTEPSDRALMEIMEISSRLKRLGYMDADHSMVHDYVHFLLKDLLDHNGETYITGTDIRGSVRIADGLLRGTSPDFILKKNNGREKTLIIEIYVGDKLASEIKSKYRRLSFFADFVMITAHDVCTQLQTVIPKEDIDYLFKNVQVFLMEYRYWGACVKLQKILVKGAETVPLRVLSVQDSTARRQRYLDVMEEYAGKVCNQDEL